MPYLTSVPINPLRPVGRDMLANPRLTHKLVEQALPEHANGRQLWRLERRGTQAELLMLTTARPSPEAIIERAGRPGEELGGVRMGDYERVLELVTTGREFRFRAKTNPVQSVRHPTGAKARAQAERQAEGGRRRRGVRVAHRTAAHQLAWFRERAERWGFELLPATELIGSGSPNDTTDTHDLVIAARETIRFQREVAVSPERIGLLRPASPPVTMSTATFEGRLRIADAAVARRSLLEGIGPGKAYGCGLLTLAPV